MLRLQQVVIPWLVAIACFVPSWTHGAPHRNGGLLYDDATGLSYDHSFLASQLNRQLSDVPRLELIHGNQSPGAEVGADKRMDSNDIDRKDKGGGGGGLKEALLSLLPPSPFDLGPWVTYAQIYYNPFLYGGPNGPPTFVPSMGIWPSYNDGNGY